jgi:hypothetical protein
VESGKCGKWRMSSGEWKLITIYGIVVQSGEWRVEIGSGNWKVESEEWSGKWRKWRVEKL